MVEVAHCADVGFGSSIFIDSSEVVVVVTKAAAASTFEHCAQAHQW